MAEKKKANPIAYVLLTLAAVVVGWLVWGTFVSSTRVDPATREAQEDLDEAIEDLRRAREKNK